jgi:hypothetical protein
VKEICAAVSTNSIRPQVINKRTSAARLQRVQIKIHFCVRHAQAKMRLRLNIDERRQANKNISAAVISVIDTRSINCERAANALFRQHLFSSRCLEVMMKTSLACCCARKSAGRDD